MYNFDEKQLEKVAKYRENGIDPYLHDCENTPVGSARLPDIKSTIKFAKKESIKNLDSVGVILDHHADENGEYGGPAIRQYFRIAGRIRFKNEMGNVGFARIAYEDIILQLFVSKKELGPELYKAVWKKLDVGDIIWCEGTFMRTRSGELSLRISNLRLLSKCIKGMPDKQAGVSDPETLQRQRYLDLMVNKDSFQRFQTRSLVISDIRGRLLNLGFMEVETPILQSIPGGASARPFTTHHNALNSELYMRIAPELYLKRLIVGGFQRVFEIGKNFRNEGISTKHNPEFTMVEFYSAYTDYTELMSITKNLIIELARSVIKGRNHALLPALKNEDFILPYGEHDINYADWESITYMDALRSAGVKDPWDKDCIYTFVKRYAKMKEEDIPDDITKLWNIVFDRFIESDLINPTFVTQYPVEISPLARRNNEDPRVTDRFELFIGGYEIANGFNELNDPVEQAQRFEEQAKRKASGDDEAMYFDEDFINALAYGMPPTAGEGIGIDRLVMLLTNSQSIRDVILFPTKK